MQNDKRMIDKKMVQNQHLPSKSFSQFFNPRMASIVCRGVIDPNLRDVSLRQMSSGNPKEKSKKGSIEYHTKEENSRTHAYTPNESTN